MSQAFTIVLILLVVLPGSAAHAQKRIKLLAWNLEARESRSDYIADQLERLDGFDIIGLSEVNRNNFGKYRQAAMVGEGANNQDAHFLYIPGTTGGTQLRLLIIYDAKRFEELDHFEVTEVDHQGHRAPLVAEFKLRGTDVTFLFMVNHLARGDANLRNRQAAQLRDWAAKQTSPIIAVGDYNFDYRIDDGEGNQGFEAMLARVNGKQVFHWVRPPELFKSQLGSKYYSVLDFVFVANKPDNWTLHSRILVDDFGPLDTDKTSDHRPVQARLFIHEQGGS